MANGIDKSKIPKIQEYYQNHSLVETAEFFGIGKSTVKKYAKKQVYLTDKERRAKAVIAVSKRRRKIKEMSVEYLGGECTSCGYKKCVAAFDFHHIDPAEKDFNISRSGNCTAWEKVKKELDKCVLLCSNCHREEHYNA